MDGGEVGAGYAVVGGAVVDGAEFSSVVAGFVDVFYSGTHGILLGWGVVVDVTVGSRWGVNAADWRWYRLEHGNLGDVLNTLFFSSCVSLACVVLFSKSRHASSLSINILQLLSPPGNPL